MTEEQFWAYCWWTFLECCSSLLMKTCLGNRKVELIMSGFVFSAKHEKMFLILPSVLMVPCLRLWISKDIINRFLVGRPWITSGSKWLYKLLIQYLFFLSKEKQKQKTFAFVLFERMERGNEMVTSGSCCKLLSCILDVYITLDIVVLQKAEENAEGGESALGPDGEVRGVVPIGSYILLS